MCPAPRPPRRSGTAPLPAVTPKARQIDLFPETPLVQRLVPREVLGPRTAATALIRVRMRSVEAPHLIFHDRHGWYCETHGPACDAVAVAREADRAVEADVEGTDGGTP